MTVTFPEFISFLNELYPFPENKYNLTNGSLIMATQENPCYVAWDLQNKHVHVYWNGEYVCHGSLTWSIESITEEIDSGWWTIDSLTS